MKTAKRVVKERMTAVAEATTADPELQRSVPQKHIVAPPMVLHWSAFPPSIEGSWHPNKVVALCPPADAVVLWHCWFPEQRDFWQVAVSTAFEFATHSLFPLGGPQHSSPAVA